jgi:predicted MFS family arabinose efflux permease
MMLSPDFASLIVAAFATLGAFFGLGAGIAVPRLDDRRALILGMAVITIGSLIGAAAPNEAILLAARIFEGAGFLGVVLAIPSILSRIVPSAQRKFVMAIWPTYMPAGIMLMLLLGPVLPIVGWRNLWLATALLTGGCCLALAIFAPLLPKAVPAEPTDHFYSDIGRILRDPTCVMLAFAFFAYTSLMFSLAFALPSLLTSTKNVALGAAGMLSALVLAMSAIGHLASGFLLRAGVPIWASIAAAFAAFAVSAFVIYAAALPPPAIALAAAIALGLGGLAPGALYAAAPQAAPHPTAVAPTIGMLQQASNLGQFTGPLALGLWVAHFGWHAAPGIVAPAALLGITTAFAIRGAMRRPPAPQPPVILASSRQ